MDAARIIRAAREKSGLSKRELARLAATSPVANDLVVRGQMMADLLKIVDMVEIRTPSPLIEFPRFEDVVICSNQKKFQLQQTSLIEQKNEPVSD